MHTSDDETYIPLTLARFGIRLVRMTEEDKEIVRLGRNKDFVRNNHVYRKIIGPDEHEQWFKEMDQKPHYILLIHYRGKKIGAVILKDIPENIESSTCGAFIWDEEFLGTRVPILSVLTAIDFAFVECGIKKMNSIVLKSNHAAIKMNEFLGFTFQDRDPDSFLITLEKAAYLARRPALLAIAKRSVKAASEHHLRISGTRSEKNYEKLNQLLPELEDQN